MCTNDFRFGSRRSHFWTLRPNIEELVSTGRLCHMNSAGSGKSPSSLRLYFFTTYPNKPVISAFGIRGVLDMCAPPVGASDMKTPAALQT
jgi:hypothetical protein